jgi:hypothetical protein
MINEFEKLSELDAVAKSSLTNGELNGCATPAGDNSSSGSSTPLLSKRRSPSEVFTFNFLRAQTNDAKLMAERNSKLAMELNVAKREAEQLKRERECADGQLRQLELALKELEKVRAALRQTENKLEMVKYQAPALLVNLLNRAFESEKELFDYKNKMIEKEKSNCYNELNKLSKRQSGVFGAFKLVHSSYIEELNHRIDLIKYRIFKELKRC